MAKLLDPYVAKLREERLEQQRSAAANQARRANVFPAFSLKPKRADSRATPTRQSTANARD